MSLDTDKRLVERLKATLATLKLKVKYLFLNF
jgi:hypothetical protein